MTSRRLIALAAVLDVLLVVVFVLIGRASHRENILGALVTLWPFLGGLIVGWLVSRAWRHPLSVWPTGVLIWASTVVVGILLRLVSRQGVETPFIIVTAVVLALFLLGWRGIGSLVARARSRQ